MKSKKQHSRGARATQMFHTSFAANFYVQVRHRPVAAYSIVRAGQGKGARGLQLKSSLGEGSYVGVNPDTSHIQVLPPRHPPEPENPSPPTTATGYVGACKQRTPPKMLEPAAYYLSVCWGFYLAGWQQEGGQGHGSGTAGAQQITAAQAEAGPG